MYEFIMAHPYITGLLCFCAIDAGRDIVVALINKFPDRRGDEREEEEDGHEERIQRLEAQMHGGPFRVRAPRDLMIDEEVEEALEAEARKSRRKQM